MSYEEDDYYDMEDNDSGHWEGEDVSLEEDAVLENAVQEEYMEQDVNVEDMEAASNNDDEVEVGVVIPENEEKPEAASNMVEVHSTTIYRWIIYKC